MIVEKLLKQARIFTYCFFMFKILLLIFYVISGYQEFTVRTIHSILRIIIVNDIFLVMFIILSLVDISVEKSVSRWDRVYVLLGISNILFSIITLVSSILIVVLTSE
jgi:hypothetical protein